MAKTRLRAADRQHIEARIINHKYEPLREQSQVLGYELAGKLWTYLHAEHARFIARAPAGALPETGSLSPRVDGKWLPSLHFDAERSSRRVFNKYAGYRDINMKASDGDGLGQALLDWANGSEELRDKRNEDTFRIRSVLANARYAEDLIEGWPEIETFVNEVLGNRVATARLQLPAVQIADLNAEFGLPPVTAATEEASA